MLYFSFTISIIHVALRLFIKNEEQMKEIIKNNFLSRLIVQIVGLLTYADISAVLDPFSDRLS